MHRQFILNFRKAEETASRQRRKLALSLAISLILSAVIHENVHSQTADVEKLSPADQRYFSLLAASRSLRQHSLASAEQSAAYSTIIERLNWPVDPAYKEYFLKFFLRGATAFPVLGNEEDYTILYNPIVDVAMIISWSKDDKPAFKKMRLIMGERLQFSEPQEQRPRWMSSNNVPKRIQMLNNSYLTQSSSPTSVFLSSVHTWVAAPPNYLETLKSVRRIAIGMMGTSDKEMPCGAKIRETGSTIEDYRRAAEQSNIDPKGDNLQKVVPVGGATRSNINFHVFVGQDSPSQFLFVISDAARSCKILFSQLVSTLPDVPK